jgi:protein CpxP
LKVMTMTISKTSSPARSWRVASATLLVALAGTVAQLAHAMPPGPMGPGHGGHGGMMLSGRALQAVGATADQQARIQDIMKAAREDVRKQHEAAGDLHAQMLQVFTATTVDARAAEAVRAKISAVHEAVSKRMLQAMIDASAVLTPEQRAKLAEEIGKRRERMERHHREHSAVDGPAKR